MCLLPATIQHVVTIGPTSRRGTHLVCSQPLVDEAHFSEVLHPGRHTGQHVHQLHDAQLTLVFLRSEEEKRGRKEKEGMKKPNNVSV